MRKEVDTDYDHRLLYSQSRFPSSCCQCRQSSVKLATPTVKTNLLDPRLQGTLRQTFPHAGSRVTISAVSLPAFFIPRAGRNSGTPLAIVNDLTINVLMTAKDGQTRTLGVSTHRLTYAKPSPLTLSQCRSIFVHRLILWCRWINLPQQPLNAIKDIAPSETFPN